MHKRQPHYHKAEDEVLVPLIRAITDKRCSYGYRRVTVLLNQQLIQQRRGRVNHKRVYRLMKQQGLLLPAYGKKPTRKHDGKIITLKPNTRWCTDTFTLQCNNGDRVFILFVMDTCDREVISFAASTIGIDGALVRDVMLESVERRFGKVFQLPHPIQWLSDNGPCYVARDTVSFARTLGFVVCMTPAYSPEINGMAEALVKTIKRDYAAYADLQQAQQVMEQLPRWFNDYNEIAPHKGLNMMSPRQYLSIINGN
jgi:putative transposase